MLIIDRLGTFTQIQNFKRCLSHAYEKFVHYRYNICQLESHPSFIHSPWKFLVIIKIQYIVTYTPPTSIKIKYDK